ncbi:hypothetical protein R1sor_008618 [Riccia sorocarpa]|uniref:Uncharacterized protein n=1 Tax=Riccia sorocarpa TaxID=122646 RepID=A0ABD3HTY2_9MARC
MFRAASVSEAVGLISGTDAMAHLREDHPWVRPLDIDKLVAENKAKFDSTRRSSPSVLRVPGYIRNVKPHVYDASFLPMGLLSSRTVESASSVYHLKLDVLSCFLELLEVDQDGWKTFCSEVAIQRWSSDTPDLENFYEQDDTYSCLPLESIQSILVTDAFFIIGAFIFWNEAAAGKWVREERPRFVWRIMETFNRSSVRSNLHACNRDIFWVFEGQIPLFLLKNAWEKVASVRPAHMFSFNDVLRANLDYTLAYLCIPGLRACSEEIEFDTCDHLLACLHEMLAWVPPHPEDKKKEQGKKDEENVDVEEARTEPEEERRLMSYIRKLPLGGQILEFVEKLATLMRKVLVLSSNYSTLRSSLPSASELAKSGIRFEGVGTTFNDVRFAKTFFRLSAVLYLPRIAIGTFTEGNLQNMLMYESINMTDEGIQYYVGLMDDLIAKEEDVELLMDGEYPVITENGLGHNKLVVDMFTSPIQNMVFKPGKTTQRFASMWQEMVDWYSNPWRRRLVQFLDSYRVAPWLVVSLLAAIFLLVLTVIQTIYTVWGFYQSN